MPRKKKPIKPQRRKRGSGSVSYDAKRDRWRAIGPFGAGTAYHRTREAATAWLETRKQGAPVPAPILTLRDALIAYAEGREHVRETTAHREDFATSHINAHLGDLPVNGVINAHIETLDKALRKKLAGSSVTGILTFLSSFYDRLIALETPGILRNPVRNYRKITPSRAREGTAPRPPVQLDYGMARKLLQALADDPYHAHVAWLLCTGMRCGELRGLRWANVLPTTIQIVEQRTERDPHTPAPLKTKRQLGEGRIIPLYQPLLLLTPRGDGLVFPGSTGGPFQQNTLRNHLNKACTRARVPRVTIHDLRHTAASGLLNVGCMPAYIAEFLGHKKQTDNPYQMTMHYARSSVEALRPYVEEWAALVLGESGGKIARIGA